LISVTFFARQSACSLPSSPQWEGTHCGTISLYKPCVLSGGFVILVSAGVYVVIGWIAACV
jgi:hypothetical protein